MGIGGGIPDGEYSLGDVILAIRLHDFSVSAALQDQPSEFNVRGGPMHQEVESLLAHLPAFQARIEGWNAQPSIRLSKPRVSVPESLNAPEYYGSEDWKKGVKSSLTTNFPADKPSRDPKYHVGPTISSNSLVKDADLARQWQQAARHTAAVEMELGGVYQAARYGGQRDYRILAIRGLSDIVGFKRSGAWTSYACHSAAAFAHALIKSGIIVPTKTTTPPSTTPDDAQGEALKMWQERLTFLQREEAIVAGAAQRFELKQQIKEAKAKIQELGG